MINLDTRLSVLTPGVQLRKGPRVGIELEYEGFRNMDHVQSDEKVSKWYLERDPSLRAGGMELISQILTVGNVKPALDEAAQILDGSHARAHARCGVHVHLNMIDLKVRHLWNAIILYALAEPTIFKQFADGREASHFCVPMWANAHFAQVMYNDIKQLRTGTVQPRSELDMMGRPRLRKTNSLGLFKCIKYSALNFRPLTQLGTIEFRQHPGTTDMKKVWKWVDFLLHLRTVATEYEDPLEILDQYEGDGVYFIRELLGLEHLDVDDLDQEEAEDVATMAAGHIAAPWTDFNWEIK